MVNPANASAEASAGGAVLFDRPEDFDEANGRVYFTVTEPAGDANPRAGAAGQVVNRGGVYSLSTQDVPDLATQSGALPYAHLAPMIEVNDPTYATQTDAQAQQGLQFPDNLAFDGAGHLWVHEDIPDNNGSFPANGIDVSKQARNQQDELYVYVLNGKGNAIRPNPDTSGPGISGGYKAADMRTSPAAHAVRERVHRWHLRCQRQDAVHQPAALGQPHAQHQDRLSHPAATRRGARVGHDHGGRTPTTPELWHGRRDERRPR